ncbi:hypothetical protein SISNIDRAFT_471356 [Sistotremastrum niveocremeum HHB9708]|uniref:Uncharacterized protein n=1 Tax=Sistotremastrum niveocremeum HHB9708 TaxID=1314777 RepID=A0A164MRZ1_9AGAM|nr:hypothetical protein SISNIDRAFT_471356 [Sistotremastrum niveocremeum HHB9708]
MSKHRSNRLPVLSVVASASTYVLVFSSFVCLFKFLMIGAEINRNGIPGQAVASEEFLRIYTESDSKFPRKKRFGEKLTLNTLIEIASFNIPRLEPWLDDLETQRRPEGDNDNAQADILCERPEKTKLVTEADVSPWLALNAALFVFRLEATICTMKLSQCLIWLIQTRIGKDRESIAMASRSITASAWYMVQLLLIRLDSQIFSSRSFPPFSFSFFPDAGAPVDQTPQAPLQKKLGQVL